MIFPILDVLRPIVAVKNEVRDALISHGFTPVWVALYALLNYKIFVVIAVLLMAQAMWPAVPRHQSLSRHLALDWLYQILSILLTSGFTWPLLLRVQQLSLALWPPDPAKLLHRLPPWAEFIAALVILDLFHYLSHVARHKIPYLWHFHSIHHSQVELNAATTFRTHPLDTTVSIAILTITYGLIGVDPVPWFYAGVTSQFWDCFIHSNIRTNLGPLGWILSNPQFHRVHHSIDPNHRDRNFGDRLVLWDILFRTAVWDRNVYPNTGTEDTVDIREPVPTLPGMIHMWFRHFGHPFRQIARSYAGSRPGRPRGKAPPPAHRQEGG